LSIAFPPSLAAFIPVLKTLALLARERGQRVFVTGGTLRDLFLGAPPPDVDLAVAGPALELGRILAERIGARFVALKEAHATCRLVKGEMNLDLAGLRAPTLEQDLRARDFTINAMAVELEDFLAGRDELCDPTGGLADLRAGLLKPAGPSALWDDPLRVLRAFRFMAALGFKIAPCLAESLPAAAPGLWRVPRERIAHEWLLLTTGREAGAAVLAMEEMQVLTRLIPALARGRGVGQNPYHHLDVLQHNLACLENLGLIANRPQEFMGPLASEVAAYLASDRRRALLFTAALLHDMGKPPAREEKDPLWATFYRHESQGAKLAQESCRELGLSKNDAFFVARLVAGHMRPFHLMGAQRRGRLSERAVRRFLASAGDDLPGFFALALADTMAGRGPLRPADAEERLLALYGEVAHLRDQKLAEALAAPPLLDGHQLMGELGLSPGPEVGRLLRYLREAQLDGKISTLKEALALARRIRVGSLAVKGKLEIPA